MQQKSLRLSKCIYPVFVVVVVVGHTKPILCCQRNPLLSGIRYAAVRAIAIVYFSANQFVINSGETSPRTPRQIVQQLLNAYLTYLNVYAHVHKQHKHKQYRWKPSLRPAVEQFASSLRSQHKLNLCLDIKLHHRTIFTDKKSFE